MENLFDWQTYPNSSSQYLVFQEVCDPFQQSWGILDATGTWLHPIYAKPSFWQDCLDVACTSAKPPFASGLAAVPNAMFPYGGVFQSILLVNATDRNFYLCMWTSNYPSPLVIEQSCSLFFGDDFIAAKNAYVAQARRPRVHRIGAKTWTLPDELPQWVGEPLIVQAF
jgi:hypothetical protein